MNESHGRRTVRGAFFLPMQENDPQKKREFRELCRLAAASSARFGMIEAGDRVLVGLSGGKDSTMLAHVLHELRRRAPFSFELECATFDPGFEGFGAAEIGAYASRCGWRFHTVALDLPAILREKSGEAHPCVLCSRLRRGKLSGLAAKLGCNKIALGHHADDVAVSFLMSLFRGQGLTTMGPNVAADSGRLRLIRPLAAAPETLIARCAELFGLPKLGECRYKGQLETGDRVFFAELLRRVETRIPDFRSQMLSSLGRVETAHLFDLRFLGQKERKND